MIKYYKVDIEHVKKSIKHIPEIFEEYHRAVIAVYLFGSFSTNATTPLSDVDIAVLYKKDLTTKKINTIHSEIFDKLATLLKTEEIDLINLNNAPISFRYNVIKGGQLIYYSDKAIVTDFFSETVISYLDIKPFRDEFNKAFIEGILKEDQYG